MSDLEEIDKAQDLIREGKVAQLNPTESNFDGFYLVTGSKEDYLVILPNYCTCTHFHISCIREKQKICKHILASRMAGENSRTIEIENWQELIFREH